MIGGKKAWELRNTAEHMRYKIESNYDEQEKIVEKVLEMATGASFDGKFHIEFPIDGVIKTDHIKNELKSLGYRVSIEYRDGIHGNVVWNNEIGMWLIVRWDSWVESWWKRVFG